jgi:hypothetical protein
MQWLLVLALAGGSPSESLNDVEVQSVEQAVERIEAQVQPGSLLFTQGDCLAVKVYTQSSYTHVGAVVIREGQPFVYDSANGVGVRCQTLANYLKSQGPTQIHVFHPAQRLTRTSETQLQRSLDARLGQPYAVAHFLKESRGSGLHCAEYVTEALQETGLIKAARPWRVSPASLVTGITTHRVYGARQTVTIEPSVPDIDHADSWCGRMWQDTKTCTVGCYSKVRGWVFCR